MRRGLLLEELVEPELGQVEQAVHRRPVERLALGRPLDLDVRPGIGADDVEVDLRPGVLRVVEVEKGDPVDDPDADRGDPADDRPLHAVGDEGRGEGDVAAGDRGRPRPAVGLEDVAVDGDRPLAEPGQVDDPAERAADEPLDLVGPAADPALGRLALAALGGRPREHRVLGGDPAGALAPEMGRDAVLDRGRAQDLRVADPDPARALGPLLDPEGQA